MIVSCIGDLRKDINYDGYVDWQDFALLANEWYPKENAVVSRADFNNDRYVDYQDFSFFASQWLSHQIHADFTGDGYVDLQDFALFASDWHPKRDSIHGDFNSDNYVDLQDLASFSSAWLTQEDIEVWDIDFAIATNKTNDEPLSFARHGVAIKRDGTEVADGILRNDNVTIAGQIEYSTIAGYRVMAVDKNYVYASAVSTPRVMYRSYDGKDWELFYTFKSQIRSAFVAVTGTLLVSLEIASGELAATVWRFNGCTFDKVIDHNVMTKGSVIESWGFSEEGETLYLGEYGSQNADMNDNARRIYKSDDDGLTWVKIHSPIGVAGQHLHRIVAARVNGERCVYAFYGDLPATAYTKVTDNGTNSWTATDITPVYTNLQPTSGIWVPEKGIIIWGSDGLPLPAGLFEYNLSTGVIKFNQRVEFGDATGFVPGNSPHYFFSIKKCGDIYIAAGSTAYPTQYSGLWASNDCVNWVFFCNSNSSSLSIAGVGPDGKVWCRKGDASFSFSIPRIETMSGALIERAGDQRINQVTADSGTMLNANYTTEKWHGPDSYHWTGSVLTSKKSLNLTAVELPDMVVGDYAYASVRVRGLIGDGTGAGKGKGKKAQCVINVQVYEYLNAGLKINQNSMSFFPDDQEWQQCIVPVRCSWDHAATKSRMKAFISIEGDVTDTATWDLCIDGVMMEKGLSPAQWHDPATVRNAEVLSYIPETFPAIFTNVFTLSSQFGSYEMGARGTGDEISYIYLRSYAVDNDNFIAVVYDTYDKKIKLINETAATNTVVASIAKPIYLHRGQPINIAVTRNGSSAALYVWTGGVCQTASGSITNHEFVSSYWGCHPSGTQGGSLVFVKDVMYDYISDDTKLLMQK